MWKLRNKWLQFVLTEKGRSIPLPLNILVLLGHVTNENTHSLHFKVNNVFKHNHYVNSTK